MTVEELTEELKQMPPTAIVRLMVAKDGAWPIEIFNIEYDKGECLVIVESVSANDTILWPCSTEGRYKA